MEVTRGLASCPICDSLDTVLVKSIDRETLVAEWKRTLDIDIYGEFQGTRSVDLFECNVCHLQFFLPYSLAGSSEMYRQLQRFDWYHMAQKWEYDMALEDLSGCGKILEIGCGVGEFIKKARTIDGLNMEGIELNQGAVEEAKKSGLPVRALGLQEAAIQFAGHYDAVCSFQVLEHVPNPKAFLQWSCVLTKSGGKLILGIPNANSFLRYQFNILDMPPHHMTRWSKDILKQLENFFPLKVEHIKVEPLAEYHVDQYVHAYCSSWTKYGLSQRFFGYRARQWASKLIRSTGLRKLLTGHSLYVSFSRI